MRLTSFSTALLLCSALFLQSCANLSDDAFAHAVKAGNRTETIRLMQPYHGKLQIQETNGKWYNPLQYAIASGDEKASFALIERGSPTRFDGKSLAYNAARVNHDSLARSFVSAGYGSQVDISQAYADARAQRAARNRSNNAALAMGCVFLAGLMAGGGSGSSDSGSPGLFSEKCPGCGRDFQPNHIVPSNYCDKCRW